MIGVIAGGEYLDDNYCKDLRLLSGAEILLLENDNILAKTIAGRTDQLLIYLDSQQPYRTKVEGLVYSFSRHPLFNYSQEKVADLLLGVSTNDLEILYNKMKIIYGGFAAGGLFLAVILGYLLAARFTKPIIKLKRAADMLAEGDFSSRVDYEAKGELGILIDTFNYMAEDLERHRQKLIETERLTAFTMMARKIAHEIKNPLTPIQIAIQDLQRSHANSDPNFPEDFKRSTNTVLEEVQSLTKIVEEFSEFAKFPAPEFRNDDLNEIVKSTVEMYAKEINEGIVNTEFTANQLPVFVDREQIKRALINLIKNGLEAIPIGGSVMIKTIASQRKATMIIADNGPGLSPGAKENLFSPYFTTKPGGSGLGLVIVKKIINEHDGQIKIVDSTEGGAAAIIELPIRLR